MNRLKNKGNCSSRHCEEGEAVSTKQSSFKAIQSAGLPRPNAARPRNDGIGVRVVTNKEILKNKTSASHQKIAVVVSEFNPDITEKLLAGALQYFALAGMADQQVKVVRVPGAVEIPLAAKWLAERGGCQAIVCLGAVIRGETSHYEYVCQQVSQGCQQVMLAAGMPVIFGVLTTDTVEQALARTGGPEGHKGEEAAAAALQMIQVKESLA